MDVLVNVLRRMLVWKAYCVNHASGRTPGTVAGVIRRLQKSSPTPAAAPQSLNMLDQAFSEGAYRSGMIKKIFPRNARQAVARQSRAASLECRPDVVIGDGEARSAGVRSGSRMPEW